MNEFQNLPTAKAGNGVKFSAKLKEEFKTQPKGASARVIVMAGVIFMAYAVIGFDGDFAMAFESIKKVLGGA